MPDIKDRSIRRGFFHPFWSAVEYSRSHPGAYYRQYCAFIEDYKALGDKKCLATAMWMLTVSDMGVKNVYS